ncbi:hypothetical protein AGMMS49983_11170 [Clostridia bacterium]|nr:hypothetical protein AGMMS49983_11170 [Clostridia bacterium]
MSYFVYHARAQGESHRTTQPPKPCQDYAYSFYHNGTGLIAAADGHGSGRYFRSDRGSKFAVESVIQCVAQFLNGANKNDLCAQLFDAARQSDLLPKLIKSIVSEWHSKVAKDIEANPFSEEEYAEVPEKYRARYENGEEPEKAYGTTLLAVLQKEDQFWLGLHIGDGRCVTIDRQGRYSQPIPWDERCFLNKTTSLCDEDAANEFRFRLLEGDQIPLATFVASDGIDDCFGHANDFEQLYQNFYANLAKLFISKPIKKAKKELRDYLPILSGKGSRDDMSIALLMDREALRDVIREQEIAAAAEVDTAIDAVAEETDKNGTDELPPQEMTEATDAEDTEEEAACDENAIPADIVEILRKASSPESHTAETKFKKLGTKIKTFFGQITADRKQKE